MNQFSFDNKQLKLKVVKSPFMVRATLYAIAFLCFMLPLFGIVLNAIEGNGIKFWGVLVLGIFSLVGFYMLRISLWNHYGEEIIQFDSNQITYIADYRWFKDGKKSIEKNEIVYSIKSVGYEEENNGILVISNGNLVIESVVKIPSQNLEKLIEILKKGG